MVRVGLKFSSMLAFLVLAGCVSTPPDFESTSFSRSEISIVASKHFDANENALKRALKPTFVKYGAPKGYVIGQMSAALEDSKDRLMGTGAFQAKFKLSKGTYWE